MHQLREDHDKEQSAGESPGNLVECRRRSPHILRRVQDAPCRILFPTRCDGCMGDHTIISFTRCPMATKPPKITRLPRNTASESDHESNQIEQSIIGQDTRQNRTVKDRTKNHLSRTQKSSHFPQMKSFQNRTPSPALVTGGTDSYQKEQ